MHNLRNQLNLISLAAQRIDACLDSHQVVAAMELAEQIRLATLKMEQMLAEKRSESTGQELYRVLLVEDAAPQRTLIADCLRTAGYFVAEVSDGNEAIEYLYSMTQPDVIITDHEMPLCTGSELLRVVRTSPICKDTLVVSTSGTRMSEELAATFDIAIEKPINTQKLLRELNTALTSRSAYEEAAA